MTGSDSQNSIVVKIFGEEYPIMGSEDPANISRVADIVDNRMREVASGSQLQARDKVAILAALSFASELSEFSDRSPGLSEGQSDRLTSLLGRLDNALAE